MQNFTTLIVDMVKKEKLFASQGGNIILAQVGGLPPQKDPNKKKPQTKIKKSVFLDAI